GENAGQPMDDRFTLSPEEAGHQLANYRESVGEQIQEVEDKEVKDAVDALRGQTPEQQQQPEQQAQPQTPQPEAQPQAATGEDDVTVALRNPRGRAAVQEKVGQYQQAADKSRSSMRPDSRPALVWPSPDYSADSPSSRAFRRTAWRLPFK